MPAATRIEELVEQRQQVQDNLEAILAGDFEPDDPQLVELRAQGEKIDQMVKVLQDAADQRASADGLLRRMGRAPAQGDPSRDLGAQLVASSNFQTWKRQGASGRAKLMDIDVRALITTTTVPGTTDRIYQTAPGVVTPLLGALNNIQVSSGSVDVVTYGAPPDAAVVAEGTQKPEAALTISIDTYNLRTLAHWVEATRQVVEDEVRLRDFITNSLIRGVYGKAEADAAGVIQGGTYQTASGSTMAEALRVAIANVNMAGYRPNAVIMNAVDAASLDFWMWDNSGGLSGSATSIWGVPIIPSGDITAGSAFVGDFQSAIHHYYRGSADLYVSDSDVGIVAAAPVSNFKRNVLTFLAEMREVTVIVNPAAISEATPTGGAVTTQRTSAKQQPAEQPEQRGVNVGKAK